jgi:antitoxin ParD1/3/4
MQVTLTPELEQLIQRRMDSGDYASANEVLRDALQLLDAYDELQRRRVEDLRQKIDEGIAQLDRGEGVEGEDSRRRLRAEISEGVRRKS